MVFRKTNISDVYIFVFIILPNYIPVLCYCACIFELEVPTKGLTLGV